MPLNVHILSAPFDPYEALRRFAPTDGQAGAEASFIGYCRSASHGEAVTQLDLQHYPGFTEREIERMAEAARAKHDLHKLLVIHRVGAIAPGEAIVLVAASSAHRVTAFTAVAELMDFLKTDAPIWKREIGPNGARWIEPTAEDRARRAAHKDQA